MYLLYTVAPVDPKYFKFLQFSIYDCNIYVPKPTF